MTPTGIDYIKQSLPKSVLRTGIILTVIGLVFAIPAYMVDPVRSTFNCLIIFAFLTSIGIGSLFLVALEYLAGAVWSVPFRRVSEFLSVTMFIAPIFAIPVLLNIGSIFSWTHPDIVAASDNLRFKAPYLDQNFFIIRTVAIFIIWFIFYFLLTRNSNKQDKSGNQALTKRNIIISAVFMPVFGISLSVIAIDWLMSLAPKWYSTIFAVYYFSGTFLAAFALLTYISVKMDKSELLVKGLGRDHYYNFGAMLFAFINFWAYIAFSQYMLIWYGNLPEETGWFLDRWYGGWNYVSIGLIVVQFVIPYIVLLSQPSKSNKRNLKFAALWILFAHYYDLYWIIMPTYNKESVAFGWIEISYLLLLIGVLILTFNFAARKRNFIPVGDPKLERAMEFEI